MTETTRTRKGSTTRNRILGEARAMLVASGLDGLVMRDVAERCGIRLGNLQYYFKTRDDLILAVIEAESAKDRAAIETVIEACEAPEKALRAIVTHLIERWRGDSAAIYTVMYLLAQHNAAFRDSFERIYAAHYATLERAVACVMPSLPKAQLKLRVRLLSSLVDGATLQTDVGRLSTFMDRIADEACAIALAPPS